mmetsp:Transcript_26648/g.50070  ORF Transcript_26648/g.50070 Transcript_26648/m.50070 type:complete len:278 (-) Transcript_26648:111-944(-)
MAAEAPPEAELQEALAAAEAEYAEIQEQLNASQQELQEARRAGSALLAATEAALAPLFAELAAAREKSEQLLPPVLGKDEESESPSTRDAIQAEVRHLQIEIDSSKEEAYRLQAEDRQRFHHLEKLRNELQEASEELVYERQRAQHHEICRQLGLPGTAWVGLGPAGIGKRTLQVRAEKRLRESAEERSARLTREVARLAGQTSEHQTTIDGLSRRLDRTRGLAKSKDHRLKTFAAQTSELHARLRFSSEDFKDAHPMRMQKTKPNLSTGKLPSLSF